MKTDKALLVFCEGPHDVAFVRQVIKYFFNAQKANGSKGDGLKFSEYPAPFNQLFRTSVENHAARDLSLDMAHKFFLPDRTMVKDDWLILLFNSGGKTNVEKVKAFLKDFLPLFEQASVFPQDAEDAVTEAKYLFLYDADHQSPKDVLKSMSAQFAIIDDTNWKLDQLTLGDCSFGAVNGDKGVYIWCDDTGKGTLEDIFLPLCENKQRDLIEKVVNFIDDSFYWKIGDTDPKCSQTETSRRKKAILTACGQRKKPGGSLNVIIDQAKIVGAAEFKNDARVKAFANFFEKFSGIPSAVGESR